MTWWPWLVLALLAFFVGLEVGERVAARRIADLEAELVDAKARIWRLARDEAGDSA